MFRKVVFQIKKQPFNKSCFVLFHPLFYKFLNLRFNIFGDTPAEIIQRFLIKFEIKFPVCVKTLYKWIHLGLLGLLKKNLLNGGRKNRTKKRPDNRGKLDERFRLIWDIENKFSNVG
ncbi:hypothetical protein GL982_11390 (plasmid) [Spiroplasma citri]|uniref:Transposase of is30 family n-terminal and c-terminal truncated protein n=1 Tax=Spiroplasma citri TaxID=2133 RepID=A0AAJ4EJ61_SPICI|nr:transposase of IS30 family protein [Spiroplasma citri]QED24689.1 hypothetical protein FRX96_04425 [Spiroplasma citri]QIA66961.1 hypothetical protein GMI18_04430 [Spiroplasma citri]QIA68798.1 hypothetical protein GL298_04295 [Spiroplasma citri]QIA70662.1 hypothetical protein GL981_04315 [Spiroplasma citri]